LGEFGKRCDDPQRRSGVGSEFVVAAAQILDEGGTEDHYRSRPIRLEAAHRSQPAFELAVIGFYRVVAYCST
jgi:hypothetical protein